jgi:hypothetical protein
MAKTLHNEERYVRLLAGDGTALTETGGALDIAGTVSLSGDVTSATHDNLNCNANLQISDTDLAFGQGLMDASIPVVIASNQTSVNVSDASAQTSLATIAGAISGSEVQADIVASLPAGDNNIGNVDIVTTPVVGTHGNANPSPTLTGSNTWDNSSSIDCQYHSKLSAFGSVNPDTQVTVKLQQSQNNSDFYDTGVAWVSMGVSAQDFQLSIDNAGARYYRLAYQETDATPGVTNNVGTIAAKH